MNNRQVDILVLVSGNGTNLQALIDAEKSRRLGGRIRAVVSDRGGVYALERARLAGIAALTELPDKTLAKPERRRELSDRILRIAEKYNIGLIIHAGFLSILSGEIVSAYAGRMINIHPSLLPKFGGEGMYGRHVHEAVLAAGEKESGCTVHIVDAGTDSGPVLLQRRVPVLAGDTPETLAERIHKEEHIALVEGASMMITGVIMKKRALISVYDKTGICDLASALYAAGWEILSTGGTAKYLQENNIPVTDVSAVTGFPECLDGRVKTLHPAIHAGLLARRNIKAHMETLERQGFSPIDLVCVNLYPFFEKVQAGLSLDETVEFIDIGGPTMLRSAAKNFRDVTVLTDPADYNAALAALNAGNVPVEFKKYLAGKVFDLTAAYDAAIARYLLETEKPDTEFPAFWPLSLKKSQTLRYGENGHQKAGLYVNTDSIGALASMEQLHGKELSYNNIRDLDLAWKAVCAFGLEADERPPLGEADLEIPGIPKFSNGTKKYPVCCVAVKHNTPCGIALGNSLPEAYEKVYACDPVSIFGGIVTANVKIDRATAEKLAELFLEIVAAPEFDPDALEILKKKKNLRIVRAPKAPHENIECISVDGGLLVQSADRKLFEKWEIPTKMQPPAEYLEDLLFGIRAVSWVKSNAIVVVKDQATTGIGGGQVNRIWAAEQALERSAAVTKDSSPARVLASDAFFPFPDVVEAAVRNGIRAIIQPGGSINDKLSVEACDKLNIAMVLTGTRHFKH